MKLRLHGNTLRLRMSQKDVAALEEEGSVEEAVTFAAGERLNYRIETSHAAQVSATFDGSGIVVRVPDAQAKLWAATEQIGIEAAAGSLNVLIEKDFHCIHRNSPEDAESFPNPAGTAS